MASKEILGRGIRLLWRAIRDEPYIFSLSVVGSLLFSLAIVASAYILGAVIEDALVPTFKAGNVNITVVGMAAAALLALSCVKVIGIFGRRLAGGVMQYRQVARYRQKLGHAYVELPAEWHRRRSTGELLSIAGSDVEAAWAPVAPLPLAVGTVVLVIVSLIALFATDWVLALFGVVLFPCLFGLNYVYTRLAAPRAEQIQKLRADLAAVAHESFDGALIVKTLGLADAQTERLRERAHALRNSHIALGRVRAIFDPLMDVLPAIATLAVLVIGVMRLDAGTVGVADIVSAAYLLTIVALPLRAMSWILGGLPSAVAGGQRVDAVLEAHKPPPQGGINLEGRTGASLELQDVTTGYDLAVLHDVSFTVDNGKTVALAGPTGAGKSTLMDLAAGLAEPERGNVLIDGIDLRNLAADELPRHIAHVGQVAFIFDGTIAHNLNLGDSHTDEEMWAALWVANADGFVSHLDGQLQARVGERGVSLSGGQRQRLALARAILRRPRLLLLDDATSSVDPVVEQVILSRLTKELEETTVLLVACRRASMAMADEVAYMENGRIVAQGKHEELFEVVPGYAAVLTAEWRRKRESVPAFVDAVGDRVE